MIQLSNIKYYEKNSTSRRLNLFNSYFTWLDLFPGEKLAILHADAPLDQTAAERESILNSFVICEEQREFVKKNIIIKVIY